MRNRDELATDPLKTRVKGLVRRMLVTLTGTATTAKALWQVTGFDLPDGKETAKAENFTGGIGLAARPPNGNKTEAIVLMVGADAGQPVAVAAVDRKTRDAVAGALQPDETMLHTSKVLVHLTADETIEARSKLGVAVSLATKADVDAVIGKLNAFILLYNAHVHPGVTAGGAATAVTVNVTTPASASLGTTKLKGE